MEIIADEVASETEESVKSVEEIEVDISVITSVLETVLVASSLVVLVLTEEDTDKVGISGDVSVELLISVDDISDVEINVLSVVEVEEDDVVKSTFDENVDDTVSSLVKWVAVDSIVLYLLAVDIFKVVYSVKSFVEAIEMVDIESEVPVETIADVKSELNEV